MPYSTEPVRKKTAISETGRRKAEALSSNKEGVGEKKYQLL